MPDQEDGDAPPAPDKAAGGETVFDESETRRRFREALDRKRQRQHATAEAAARDGSEKSHGAQGPTKGRADRRKSI
jgi:hypothetical protein